MATDSSDVITKVSGAVNSTNTSDSITVDASDTTIYIRGYEAHGTLSEREAFTLTKA